MNTGKWTKNKKIGFGVVSIIGWFFLGFVVGWLFLIPISAVALLIYGYVAYMRERKHRIEVAIKPTEAMRAIARREEELKREKERLLREEMGFKI